MNARRESQALWVEVRDSSTGERRVDLYDAPPPRRRSDRERLLNRYLPMIFPGAKLRTYSGGVGVFVAGHLLVTARFGAVAEDAALKPLDERLPEPIAAQGQGSLFAA